jgi:AraC family transcriptional regulator of arabinose operon
MENTAVSNPSRERFWHFLAGETFMHEGGERRVYRPSGMEAWVLHCTVSGKGGIGRGEQRLVAAPGVLMLFPAGVVHDYGPAEPHGRWLHLWATFIPRASWDPWMRWPETSMGARQVAVTDPAQWRRTVRRMRDMIAHFRGVAPCREEFAMNALEEVILTGYAACGQGGAGRLDSRVAELMHWMRLHLSEPLSVELLARQSSLSPSRLAHVFREHAGTTPMRFVERLRVTRAQELLLGTDAPVKRIAVEVGFGDPLYFSHVFRKVVGRSPRAFRGGK